ncbi:MAG: GTPase Era [Gemmatimonadetes bacterium]|uniref:GTPase Era n=1 Tax=Candidatus Kutchimonas denitrificans TaxID=3056748 RepID=A0AAE4Z9S5_9BACT|nr:GTPase Era [Gemmatimonadota bacterium]NIR75297.1 GTPase Era [Candidatus Kutchimonas denitrificans]NIS00235.1 GTPase Era [Gemmatimonadota bacterium]NIT65827.1 GTPase Era [Gemmatimonadota bacterium]NIU53105.1 GTPase Era [Gemmatimonadota bacterium]
MSGGQAITADFRCGYVALAGPPNVGKSTMMNALIGQRLSIVSPKSQTTRERVGGILTGPDYQILFIDAPGLIEPTYALQTAMRQAADDALEEADVIVFVADGTRPDTFPGAGFRAALGERAVPVLVALNKRDLLDEPKLEAARARVEGDMAELIAVSSLTGDGLNDLLGWVVARLPHSPPLFPTDETATQPVRFFVEEYVRETCMELLREEVPYSIICRVEEFREAQQPIYVAVTIYVERESQKGIVIGSGGSTIRDIGRRSREKIEALLNERVYLDLRVKVMAKWSRKRDRLKQLGFHLPSDG